nr:hypothetical protein BaRGS_004119 [Batillaria attramentaria]
MGVYLVILVFWTALPLFGWNSYVPEPFLTSCTIQWAAETLLSKSYIVLTVFTCYLLPVSVVVFCYTSILHKSRKLTFGARKNSSMVRLEEVLWHHKVKTERRVTKVNCVSWGLQNNVRSNNLPVISSVPLRLHY